MRRRALNRMVGWGRAVYIVGMHRSGTSAVTRLVNLMGVPLSDPSDLLGAVESSNPTGHWESLALLEINDRILTTLGGAWSAPPILLPGWERGQAMAELRRVAVRVFAATYRTRTWAWKDPRICLTLPFWRSCINSRAVAILVLRHPIEIARSLETRNGFPMRYSLALWERYMRHALRNVSGLPTLVTAYDDLLQDASGWCAHVGGHLTRHGFKVASLDAATLATFVDPNLRHAALGMEALTEDPNVSESQRELFQLMGRLAGINEPMPLVDLPLETPTTEALLAAHREAVTRAGNEWLVPVT